MSFNVFPSNNLEDIVIPRKGQMFLFQEEFGQNLSQWTPIVTVTGLVTILGTSGRSSDVLLRSGAGLGTAKLSTPSNIVFSTSGYATLDFVTLLNIPVLATVAEDFTLHLSYCGDGGGNGFSISYNRGTSLNWLMTTWVGAVPTYTATAVPVTTGNVRVMARWTTATNAVQVFINDVSVGTVTMAGVIAGNFLVPGWLLKLATAGVGTTVNIDYTYALATFTTPRA